MIEKGVTPPKGLEVNGAQLPMLYKWLLLLHAAFAKTETYTLTINPAIVAPNSTSEQSFSLPGVSVNDIININKPTYTAGLGIVNIRSSADDLVDITFMNTTGVNIDPPGETYLISTVRR